MNTADFLISLQAMAPHLSSAEISDIYNNKCSKDFNRSVDHLLSMAKNDSNIEIKSGEKSNNETNTNTLETYVDMNALLVQKSSTKVISFVSIVYIIFIFAIF